MRTRGVNRRERETPVNTRISRLLSVQTRTLAMQKVEGSSPFIRLKARKPRGLQTAMAQR